MSDKKRHDSTEDLRSDYQYRPWPEDKLTKEARQRSSKIEEVPVSEEVLKETATHVMAHPPKFSDLNSDRKDEEFLIYFNFDSKLGQVLHPTISGYSPGGAIFLHHLVRNVDLPNNKLTLILPDELKLEPSKKLLILKFGEVRIGINTDKIKMIDLKPAK